MCEVRKNVIKIHSPSQQNMVYGQKKAKHMCWESLLAIIQQTSISRGREECMSKKDLWGYEFVLYEEVTNNWVWKQERASPLDSDWPTFTGVGRNHYQSGFAKVFSNVVLLSWWGRVGAHLGYVHSQLIDFVMRLSNNQSLRPFEKRSASYKVYRMMWVSPPNT